MTKPKERFPYREPRLRTLDLVQIQWTDGESGSHAQMMGRTLNVSRGGLEIELDQHIPNGTIITMDIALGGNVISEFQGIVRHAKVSDKKQWILGVEFFQLTPEGYMLIEEFLKFQKEDVTGADQKVEETKPPE